MKGDVPKTTINSNTKEKILKVKFTILWEQKKKNTFQTKEAKRSSI
jgi:hypothetical protein